MKQQNRLVYVHACYINGILQGYAAHFQNPLQKLLKDIGIYKKVKWFYSVNFLSDRVIVKLKNTKDEYKISLFVCNNNEINNYL